MSRSEGVVHRQPDEGTLPPSVAIHLREILSRDTQAPEVCWFGVWRGFGWDYREAADEHASERARLGADGRTPPFVGGQIAAIAKVNGLKLVTSIINHFREFQGLRLLDWALDTSTLAAPQERSSFRLPGAGRY